MKFYRHYKNKPYKYLGVARHSETLEEMALYETLYQNDLGKLWVRPKAMFEEGVKIDGKLQPRFAKIPLKVEVKENFDNQDLDALKVHFKNVLSNWDQIVDLEKLKLNQEKLLLKAFVDEKLVGVLLGYRKSKELFFTCFVGVTSEFRKLGIASDLVAKQIAWCQTNAIQFVQTSIPCQQKEMLILSLREGFEITGSSSESKTNLALSLQKSLK